MSALLHCLPWLENEQVWLQEFAWLEEDLGYCQQRRNLRGSQKSIALLESEPMFCVQTAATALYWALLVYDVREVSHQPAISCILITPNTRNVGRGLFRPALLHGRAGTASSHI